MIYKKHLKNIVEKTLRLYDLFSEEALELVLGTIAQESRGGFYLRQLNGGPALGITQVEPATFQYLQQKYPQILGHSKFDDLETNLKLAILACRLKYLTIPDPIPLTMYSQAQYWKKFYNTSAGSGTIAEYLHNYKLFVEETK